MRWSTAAALGVAAFGSLVVAVPIIAVAAGEASTSTTALCMTGRAQAVDTPAVRAQVEAALRGGDRGEVSVPGLTQPKEQIANARTIQATGVAMGIPVRGQIVALATALQESVLRNIQYGDRDSLGLFQQRPSQGWGSAKQILDPVYSSTKFYQGLKQVSGWQSMTVTQAAQAVQRSGFPDAYAKWEPLATALQKAIASPAPKRLVEEPSPFVPTGSANGSAAGPDSSNGAVGGGGCAAGDGSAGAVPAGALPDGYTVPADTPPRARTAIRWALAQLGTPYQWGGTCTDAHGDKPMGRCDCSSLMQQAYKSAGLSLGRTTFAQVKDGKPVPLKQLRPGDLLFTQGTAAAPRHVGMFIGDGLIVHAPRTNDKVRVARLADWKPQILTARRIV